VVRPLRRNARALSEANRQRVSDHLRLAESLGAKTASSTAGSIPEGILKFARRENVTKLVVGKPVQPRWKELLRPSPVDELVRHSGDIDVYVIRGESEVTHAATGPAAPPRAGAGRILLAPVIATAGAVAIGKCLDGIVALPDIAMIFLLAAGCVAFLGSRRAAVLMAILSVLAFNFFFVPPLYTFHVAGAEYLITFLVLFVVTMVLSELSLRLRMGHDLARRSEARTAAVYRLSARLAEVRGVHAVVDGTIAELTMDLGVPTAVTYYNSEGQNLCRGALLDEKESAVVKWVRENARPAGLGTETLSSSAMTHYPLIGPRGTMGVVSLGGPKLGPEQAELLHALMRHVALVLSVEGLEEERRRTTREVEAERLRSSILSAVSHDLRTPLASILGSASSLQEQAESLDAATRSELLSTITDEADRLNRLIANLLEMTKIEGDALRLNRVPLPVDEIVGASLHALRRLLHGRAVTTNIPADLGFVEADELLIQQVLINLLENASKHTPPGTPIDLSASAAEGASVRVTVADRGPGLPDVDPARLFERFYRGDKSGTGAGLGLAICKGIIDAHGGTIGAGNREGGGAWFSFTLPVASMSLAPDEELEQKPP
jgi:two-component system sensor histidine kinase KdpD